jgi:hypothetical protein
MPGFTRALSCLVRPLDGEDVITNVDVNLVFLYTRQLCFGYNLVLLKFK